MCPDEFDLSDSPEQPEAVIGVELDDGFKLHISKNGGLAVINEMGDLGVYTWQEVFDLLKKAEFVSAVATENTQDDSGDSNES